MPPKKAIFPLYSGRERMATAPTWARASRMRTPGITWYSGKCPAKKGSFTVTALTPLAQAPGSKSVILSTSRKGGRWGMISLICSMFSSMAQPSHFFSRMLALCPPKPRELDRA